LELKEIPGFVIWILLCLGAAGVITLAALGLDFLARRLYERERARKLVRRIMLIESTEKFADAIAQIEFKRLASRGGLVLLAVSASYFLLSIVSSFFIGSFIYYFLPWVVLILFVGGIFWYVPRKK
jgi:hypothetical protein